MKDYDIAVRPDDDGEVDDVVVIKPDMFRLERMSDDSWWMACYWTLDGQHEELAFWISRRKKEVVVHVTSWPSRGAGFVYEAKAGPEVYPA